MKPLVKRFAETSERDKKNLLRGFSRMDNRQRELITEMKVSIFRTSKEDFIGKYTFVQIDHAALILALAKHKADLAALERKGDIDPRDLQRIQIFREIEATKQKDRMAPLAGYIERNLIHTIKRARESGLSWRQTSKLVARVHKKKISHTYLRNIYERTLAKQEIGRLR